MFALIVLLVAAYPDFQEIPLNKIWGYDLPGTKNIRKLEPKQATGNLSDKEVISRSLVLQIQQSLMKRPKPNEKAGAAFIVVGTDQEALKNAHAIMIAKAKKEPPRVFPANSELSLVFYSYASSKYVRLLSVEQSDR